MHRYEEAPCQHKETAQTCSVLHELHWNLCEIFLHMSVKGAAPWRVSFLFFSLLNIFASESHKFQRSSESLSPYKGDLYLCVFETTSYSQSIERYTSCWNILSLEHEVVDRKDPTGKSFNSSQSSTIHATWTDSM